MEGWDEAVGDARGDSDGEGEQQAAAAAEGGGPSEGRRLQDVSVDAGTADKVAQATSTVQALEDAEKVLREAGCMKEAQGCRCRMGVTLKRARELAREDDGPLEALNAQRAHDEAQQAKQRRMIEDANAMTTTLRSIERQVVIADNKRKAALDKAQGVEAAVAAKHTVPQCSTDDLN
jgi:hypothetical protein